VDGQTGELTQKGAPVALGEVPLEWEAPSGMWDSLLWRKVFEK